MLCQYKAIAMTLLTLELLGDSTSIAQTTHTLDFPLSFTTATLRAVDLHAPGSQLTHTWNKAQTGVSQVTSVDVYSPLYADLNGLCDEAAARFYSRHHDGIPLRTPIPVGIARAPDTHPPG